MKDTLLVEIGLEELPPLAVSPLSEKFGRLLNNQLVNMGFETGTLKWFGTPRRVAVVIEGVSQKQPNKQITKKGPAIRSSFDENGKPTKSAIGFAKSCGVELEKLSRLKKDKEEWLAYNTTAIGKPILEAIVPITDEILQKLPLTRKMRWGDGGEEFLRPIRWVTILYGDKQADGSVFGIKVDHFTYGHRFMGSGKITLSCAQEYCDQLKANNVIVDQQDRKIIIREQITNLAATANATPVIEEILLEEVSALVEWPRGILGTFDKKFLQLPEEVVTSSMQDHQKYFPLRNAKGALSNAFVTIANIESENKNIIRQGNERVIRPRLEDAKFFYEQDQKAPLLSRYPKLSGIVFERRLGNLFEKSERVKKIALFICKNFSARDDLCLLGSEASRCDLTTEMVAEFPSLQGIMGSTYARLEVELSPIADAIRYFYHPRFANDELPPTAEGQCLAFADKLDTIVGISGIGLKPTGDKDPFALRRAAIGLVRLLVENEIELCLTSAIQKAITGYQGISLLKETDAISLQFIRDRMRGYFVGKGMAPQVCKAAMSSQSQSPADIACRINALRSFYESDESKNLIVANRRIVNILRKNPLPNRSDVAKEELFSMDLEIALAKHYAEVNPLAKSLYQKKKYEEYLFEISSFKNPVDQFFENVQVISENKTVTNNRLALLGQLNELFSRVGDLSLLGQPER
ncbi:MAG: glycine--tRNA ligase subunit beta [Pseudomonadota bacterium]|nr:glycine--tRNA ligase subunit beta [Pseudomonadota bacterium]